MGLGGCMARPWPPLVPRGSGVTSEFMAFLTQRPDLNEICNHIILTWPGFDVIQQAAIGLIRPDGTIEFSGCFGFEAQVSPAFERTTVWDATPAAAAVRGQRLLLLADRVEIQDKFPNYAKKIPNLNWVLAAPLMSHSTPNGVCVVSSTEPMTHPQQSSEILNDYSLALSLYVQLPPSDDSQSVQPLSRIPTELPPRPTLVPHQLTERQLTVLRFLCQGFTNRQIARRMGFSESTVRQETMNIYAYFGVRGRAEAVEAALDSGLVTETSGGQDAVPQNND